MNRILATVAALAGITWIAQGAEVGQPAPQFSAKDCCGADVKLSDYKGKIVVLEWFNPNCPYVKKFYDGGHMQKLQETYTGKGVAWLQVVTFGPGKSPFASMDEAMKYTADKGVKANKLVMDDGGAVGKAYGAKTTPHMFVIDKDGKLAYAGAIDDDRGAKYNPSAKNYVAAAIDEIMAGKPVSTPNTQSYGCGVKY
ncbi:MAG: redoxin domain-containing protein [Verrucomicrobiae bacterium]|nr:redoxin domain-containing protein [Verrucomicrobiae bacterium]